MRWLLNVNIDSVHIDELQIMRTHHRKSLSSCALPFMPDYWREASALKFTWSCFPNVGIYRVRMSLNPTEFTFIEVTQVSLK